MVGFLFHPERSKCVFFKVRDSSIAMFLEQPSILLLYSPVLFSFYFQNNAIALRTVAALSSMYQIQNQCLIFNFCYKLLQMMTLITDDDSVIRFNNQSCRRRVAILLFKTISVVKDFAVTSFKNIKPVLSQQKVCIIRYKCKYNPSSTTCGQDVISSFTRRGVTFM